MMNNHDIDRVSNVPEVRDEQSFANTLKTLQRKRLNREAYADPEKYRELVRIKSSPVYNANAEIIQAVTMSHGSA